MYDVNALPISFFEDGTPVQFKININTTPTVIGKYYAEVVYHSPTSNSWVIIWFSHNYRSVPEAFDDCWMKQNEFIKNNPNMAC